jgi:hypothetical protein
MSKQSKPPSGDYEIGYGRPPKAHQFEPGKSGNPGGRRKRAIQGLPSAIRAELEKPMVYMTKDGPRKAPAVVLIARQTVREAVRGNRHSLKSVTDILSKKHNDFVEPENPVQAETERAAVAFDVKLTRALAAMRRQADEELEAQAAKAKTEEMAPRRGRSNAAPGAAD